jgi:hypothetical protein
MVLDYINVLKGRKLFSYRQEPIGTIILPFRLYPKRGILPLQGLVNK